MIAGVVSVAFVGCMNDGCNDQLAFNYDPDGTGVENCVYEPLDIEFSVATSYGDLSVTTGEGATAITTADGRSMTIDYFGIYLTEISLKDGDSYVLVGANSADCVERDGDAFLVKEDDRTYSATFLPNANTDITALRFNIGVDSCRNSLLDPATKLSGPFAPQSPTMYWSWASGFRFVTIEGMVDASPNADGSDMQKFEYHTGMNMLLRTVEYDLNSFEVENGKVMVPLKVDFEKAFEGIDFTTELVTHTMDNMPLAQKVSDNMVNAITLDED